MLSWTPSSNQNHWQQRSFFFQQLLFRCQNEPLRQFEQWTLLGNYKDDTTNRWFSCNDKVVFEIKVDDLNNKTYVLFYVRKWFTFYFNFISVILIQGGFVNSDIVFGCDDPTHKPSSVQILSLLTQFSGLTTLQSLVSGKPLQGGLTRLRFVFEEWRPHI